MPDANYSRELPLFNERENVTTVGYVRMQYCKRSVEQVFDDVEVYGGWSKNHESNGIYVEGIFLDEAPNEYSHDVGKYLNLVSEKIKNTPGILGEKLVSLSCNQSILPNQNNSLTTRTHADHPQPRHSPRQRTNANPPRGHRRLRGELLALPLVRSKRAARPGRLRPQGILVHFALCASQTGHTARTRAATPGRVHLRDRSRYQVLRGVR
jgi:hypothetical protein